MEKTIAQYQKSFNIVVDRLKSNSGVLAVMVFGSMVTGDLWAESDIDLFVILNKKMQEIKNIYTEEKDVPIHIKLMSKEKFMMLYDEDLRGGFLHRIFSSSRLVFSKDVDITSKYDSTRYYPDLDRERWSMVYLGSLLKNIDLCKKYLSNDVIYTSYGIAVKCLEDYAKLYVNYSGYMISKDAMTMAMNLNDEYKACVDKLFFHNEDVKKALVDTVDYLQGAVDSIVRDTTKVLINFMREKDCFLSAEDIENDKMFKNFNIPMEEILNKLNEKNIIKKETRDYKVNDDKMLFKENVYFI